MSLKDKFMTLCPSSTLLTGSSRKTRIVSASALLLALCAFGAAGMAPMVPDPADLPIRAISEELALPNLSQQVARLEAQDQLYITEDKMRTGDTLASLLARLGVDDASAINFIKTNNIARSILRLKSGTIVYAQTNIDGELQLLRTMTSDGSNSTPTNLVIRRNHDQFTVSQEVITLEKRIEMHAGTIHSSLFAATDAADIPDSVASQIVQMFSTNINFASDLQYGDRFNIAYETFWQNGQFVRAGRILAGEFINGSKSYQAVWFDEPSNAQGGGYYGFDGKSLKKTFLKSPLAFTRISSGFAMRAHPILGIWKQHNGVDFAAPTGTPVHATADGTIDFSGTQTGYGNMVMIKHDNNYSTVYAHMSRFAPNLRKGNKISQGDVIGFVGQTGWATGPHLHYEFRVSNQPRDPMSITVPHTQSLAAADLQRFRSVAADMTHRFMLLQGQEPDEIHADVKTGLNLASK